MICWLNMELYDKQASRSVFSLDPHTQKKITALSLAKTTLTAKYNKNTEVCLSVFPSVCLFLSLSVRLSVFPVTANVC